MEVDPARTRSTHLCVSLRVFASSREANVAQAPSPHRPSAVSRWQWADLGLESPSDMHSRSFVVHPTSGGVSPLVTALTSELLLQPQRRAAPSPFLETELSRHLRHATVVDGDSDLPFPHTRDATRQLCSTAVCWGPDFRESSVRTAGQRRVCGTWGSMLRLAAWPPLSGLTLAATSVLFPHRSPADHSLLAETETRVNVAAKNRACCRGLRTDKSAMKMLCPRDLPASVRQKLTNLSRERNEDFQFVLSTVIRIGFPR
ncbi:MAG: hypothetical protein RLZZ536_1209 [Planctomycetota bacterium]